jgi:hypothetical protein
MLTQGVGAMAARLEDEIASRARDVPGTHQPDRTFYARCVFVDFLFDTRRW